MIEIIFFLLILLFLNYQFDKFLPAPLIDETPIKNNPTDLNCYVYGCKTTFVIFSFIGKDISNNKVFNNVSSNDLYILKDEYLQEISPKTQILLNQQVLNIPFILNNDKYTIAIKLEFNGYQFIGYITNNFYNIQYLLYGKEVNNIAAFDKLYEYIIVTISDANYIINNKLQSMNKLNEEETLYINNGSIRLGPFKLIFSLS